MTPTSPVTAALFHCQFAAVQPSKGDRLHKVSAYNSAARVQAPDGAAYDFTRKAREYVDGCLMLPAGAPAAWAADPLRLWAAAEAAEKRVDGQPARLVEFAIPREVRPEHRLDFARSVIAPWIDDEGVAAQLDLHCPRAADGGEQPHAHIILSRRALTPDGFAARKTSNTPWTANKGRDMRATIASRMNAWLEANGYQSRVDHRSHAARGDPTPPEPDVGRRAVEAYKRDPDDADAYARVLADRPKRRALRKATAEREAAEVEIQHLEEEQRHVPPRTDPGRPVDRHPQGDAGDPRRHRPNPRSADPARGREPGRSDRADPRRAGRDPGIASEPAQQNRRHRLPASIELTAGPLRPGDDRLVEARRRLTEADGRAARQRRADARQAAEHAAFRGRPGPADDRLKQARRRLANTLPGSVSPGDGVARRRRRDRHLAGLLREHYSTGWLPESIAANLLRVELDRECGTATLHLRGGGRLVDHGDRISLLGRTCETAVAELVRAVERHGWQSVSLTGSQEFRRSVATMLADRRPPVDVVGGLDDADRQAVAAEVARRAQECRRAALEALRKTERDAVARLVGRQPNGREAAALVAVRDAQAAASRGQEDVIRAAAGDDMDGALRAGAAWRRRQEAPATRPAPRIAPDPVAGPRTPGLVYRPSWTRR